MSTTIPSLVVCWAMPSLLWYQNTIQFDFLLTNKYSTLDKEGDLILLEARNCYKDRML